MDKGPVISRNFDDDDSLSKELIKISKKYKIPYQLSFSDGGMTNNHYYRKLNTKNQLIGYPVRNMHSSIEIVDYDDIENTIILIIQFLIHLSK